MHGLLNFVPKIELLMYLHEHRGCSSLYMLVVQWKPLRYTSIVCISQWFQPFVEPRGFSYLYMLVVRQEPLRYTTIFFVYSGCSNLLYSLEVSVICICWWFQSSVYSSGAWILYILEVSAICICWSFIYSGGWLVYSSGYRFCIS